MSGDYPDESTPIITRQLILASGSPRRASLLQKAGFVALHIMIPHVKEGDDPLENARRKAEAVAELNPRALVIGADTVVSIGGKARGAWGRT